MRAVSMTGRSRDSVLTSSQITRLPSFSPEQRLCALMIITETSQIFKEAGDNLETSAALEAEFLDNLIRRPSTEDPAPIQTPTWPGNDIDDWINSLLAPHDETPGIPSHKPAFGPSTDYTAIQSAEPAFDADELGNAEWDQTSHSKHCSRQWSADYVPDLQLGT